MSKAILNTKKLKSASGIRGCANHNSRKNFTPNADQTKKNEILVDSGPDAYHALMDHIKDSGYTRKIRPDAVLGQEVFLSVSKEYFREDNPAAAGTWDQVKMEHWRDAAFKFLKDEFGDHMIECRLHLDESTPHIHAVVVSVFVFFDKQTL